MISKQVITSFGFFILLCNFVDCRRIPGENEIRKDEPYFRLRLPTGGREVLAEALGVNSKGGRTETEEVGEEKFLESDVDEETISKAEKIADEDLLNGLSRILKNNETLEDVFRAENVYEFP